MSDKKRIILSRTDSIGDVMLTLPMCKWLKSNLESCEILFLGKGYTRAIVEHYGLVDEFIDWNDFLNSPAAVSLEMMRSMNADVIIHVFPDKAIATLAKKARIKTRIGTSHRSFHLLTCNKRVNFTRKRSELHESQLNHELLRPLGLNTIPDLSEITEAVRYLNVPNVDLPSEFESIRDYTILHPKSQGSAKEWPVEKYLEVATQLASEEKKVIFTGTENEGKQFRLLIPENDNIIDTTGKLSLEQLMVLISRARNLVACSTGPLHIAGFYGVNTVGLFSPRRPIHQGRWKALGEHVQIVVNEENCPLCQNGKDCDCIKNIPVEKVMEKLK